MRSPKTANFVVTAITYLPYVCVGPEFELIIHPSSYNSDGTVKQKGNPHRYALPVNADTVTHVEHVNVRAIKCLFIGQRTKSTLDLHGGHTAVAPQQT